MLKSKMALDEASLLMPPSWHYPLAEMFLKAASITPCRVGSLTYKRRMYRVLLDLQKSERLQKIGVWTQALLPVSHCATFKTATDARKYRSKLNDWGYAVKPATKSSRLMVEFKHQGTVALDDIAQHTVRLDAGAESQNGSYEGWFVTI